MIKIIILIRASRGGFSVGVTASGNPVWRNPCGSHVLPLLPHVLSLAHALHSLHALPQHARALQLPAAEQHTLLGLRDHDAAPPPADRMQTYLYTLHDSVCIYIIMKNNTMKCYNLKKKPT